METTTESEAGERKQLQEFCGVILEGGNRTNCTEKGGHGNTSILEEDLLLSLYILFIDVYKLDFYQQLRRGPFFPRVLVNGRLVNTEFWGYEMRGILKHGGGSWGMIGISNSVLCCFYLVASEFKEWGSMERENYNLAHRYFTLNYIELPSFFNYPNTSMEESNYEFNRNLAPLAN